MAQRICITSQKGGVGKTTVALNLAVALCERGKRVLLVDLDPQGGVGLALARGDTALIGLTEVLTGRARPEDAVMATRLEGLSLLPRGRLDPMDVPHYEQAVFAAGALAKVIGALQSKFDLVLYDTPAGLGMPTRAALSASDWALVIVQTEALALRSLSQLLRVLEQVRATVNPGLKLLGLLPTMVELRKEPSREVMEELWGGFAGVMESTVPRAEVFAAASSRGVPVAFLEGPLSPEARRFESLAVEVETTLNQGAAHAAEQRPARQLL
ncbi:MAG: ParA family protein [Archangiaceae bacterium]|nr:ParA family protein [Archangiaceae bacterium]